MASKNNKTGKSKEKEVMSSNLLPKNSKILDKDQLTKVLDT